MYHLVFKFLRITFVLPNETQASLPMIASNQLSIPWSVANSADPLSAVCTMLLKDSMTAFAREVRAVSGCQNIVNMSYSPNVGVFDL